ncbi:4-phosphoerythronate dehydrogenase [Thalassotalea psychrophila]|uniref:Erythronate-4-phosphate dehydrogenase n=1 Tax=Thalassotalea psychrophila TaxID=3065647 RepID=A0ABY9TYR3_9GAMM|nr:4-phosphoerythronate dehydrogenase [Colwelliaceae bacterium SQ149]
MKIFYDENIPYAKEFFSDFGELVPFAGRELSAEQIKEADVLLVRSITKVNEQLLHLNTSLKFVGTATIGFDHVDQNYLKQRGVVFTNAPGCNAISVAEYVLSALMVMVERLDFDLKTKTIGIVGAGNTGTRLSEKLDAFGINYLLCDPLLEKAGDSRTFSSLKEILGCDIISLHVPITQKGDHRTFHMFDDLLLSELSNQQILINSCRGEVINNQALLQLKKSQKGPHIILDVWENEPNVLTELIPYCEITTAHIAGYSLEGKARGTEMLYQALSKLVNKPIEKQLEQFLPKAEIEYGNQHSQNELFSVKQRVFDVYDVRRDDKIFREQLNIKSFDYLRKNYPVRREFSALELSVQQCWPDTLKNLGFNVKD